MTALPPRDAPPPPGPVRDIHMPRPRRLDLPNGLRLMAVEMRGLPRVALVASLDVGDRDDPRGSEGLATLTSRLLKEGTASRRGPELAEAIDGVGGSLDVSCDQDRTQLHVDVLSPHLPLAMDLVADMLRAPSFPPAEVEQLKERTIQELAASVGDAEFLALELAAQVMYGTHPYRHVVADPRAVARLSRREALQFHLERYVPGATTILAVGDLDAGAFLDAMRARLGGWERAPVPRAPRRAGPVPPSPTVHLRHRPGSVQSMLRLVAPAINRAAADFIPLEVMANILGGGTSSRLFLNLRQSHGFTYGIRSNVVQRVLASELVIASSVRTEVTEAALAEVMAELDRLAGEDVPAEELAHCQQEMVGQFPLSLESHDAIAGRLLARLLFGLPPTYWDAYRRRVLAVRPRDVRRVAAKYARGKRFKIVVVGDAPAIAGGLRRFGGVRRYPARARPAARGGSRTA